MADASVRLASPDDAATVATIMVKSWIPQFSPNLPADLVEGLQGAEGAEMWRTATTDPPPRTHLLVAQAGPEVVGYAVIGPSEDPDARPETDGEIGMVCVLPDHLGEGHGSRLVNAAVDYLRRDGFTRALVWVTGSDPLWPFLEGAGFAVDGANRTLDMSEDGSAEVTQVRLHASIVDA